MVPKQQVLWQGALSTRAESSRIEALSGLRTAIAVFGTAPERDQAIAQ